MHKNTKMLFFYKLGRVREVLKKEGLIGLVSLLIYRYGLPVPLSTQGRAKAKWIHETKHEVGYWDGYFFTKGYEQPEDYKNRFNFNLPLQSRPAALLTLCGDLSILDVGAGPLTYLEKIYLGKPIKIIAETSC
jgi:hypothetical protein